jgi:hypothetical protein
MKKFFAILLFPFIVSCILAKGKPPYRNGGQSAKEILQIEESIPETNDEEEWLIIGGQKVETRPIPSNEEDKYYRKEEIESITDIALYLDSASKTRTNSLEGIEHAVNLKYLFLFGWAFDAIDYTPLKGLQYLENIIFKSGKTDKVAEQLTKIPDFSGWVSRHNIREIKFENCALESLDNLKFLPNLRKLIVVTSSKSALTDIRAINQLRKLEYLEIASNESSIRIEEISALTELKNLKFFVKSVDANGIEKLKSLETVYFLDGKDVVNAESLSGLSQCTHLYMTLGNIIPDTRFLASMTSLKILQIHHTRDYGNEIDFPVFDLTPIMNLSQLEHIELYGFSLKNVAALDNLEYLKNDYAILFLDSVLYDESEKTTKNMVFYYDGR